MRVLLDECLPKRLKFEVEADLVATVPEVGWAGKKNGELLRAAAADFDAFLTVDQHLEQQQSLQTFDLAVIVLRAASNDLDDLRPLMDAVNQHLKTIEPGEIEYV